MTADPEPYDVRAPRASDAPALGRLHVQIWREAYSRLMDADFLAGLDPQQWGERWARNIAGMDAEGRTDAGVHTLVATTGDDEPVGFISVGPALDEDPPTADQLWVVNVLAAHHGTGVADRLMAGALGDRPAYCWVADGNRRAMAFYRRHGFETDGASGVHGDSGAREVRMVRHATR